MKPVLHASVAAALFVALSCSSGGTEPAIVAVALVPSGSTSLSGVVAGAASSVPSVKVIGSNGRPFEGVTVTFTASGGGTPANATAVSTVSGVASSGGWTLGTTAGTQTLTASSAGLESVTFSATAAAGPAASVAIVSGNNQQAAAGASVGPLVVRVTDQYSNAVSGATVAFQVLTGGGQITTSTVTTDLQGQATASGWTLGSGLGENTLKASVGGAEQTFTATAVAGAASRIAVASGDGQTGLPGTTLTTPLRVVVSDAFDNPVSGVTVTFNVASGSGTLSAGSGVTGSDGGVATSLTLNGVGPTTVTATSAAVPGTAAVFSASTGPTITGTVALAPEATSVTLARAASASRSAGLVRPAGKGRKEMNLDRGLSPREAAARMIDTRGRLIVSFRKDAFRLPQDAHAYVDAGLRRTATTAFYGALEPMESAGMIQRREVSPAIAAVRVDVRPGQDPADVRRQLLADPRVLAVEEDVIRYALDDEQPRVWGRTQLFGPPVRLAPAAAPGSEVYPSDLLMEGQLWHYRMIDLPRAWSVTTGSNAVRVAILDTGIRPDHPGVAPLLAPNDHFDFTDGSTAAFSFPQPICGTSETFLTIRGTPADMAAPRNMPQHPHDVYIATNPAYCWTLSAEGSHGTHVAGTIGSPANDGYGGVGVNWNVQLIAVRVLGITGSGFSFDIAQGILYAGGLPATYTGAPPGFTVQMPPAHVMNMSLGSTTPSTAERNAMIAVANNTLIVASAGNNRNSEPNYPAAFPEALSVVALAPDGGLASYTTVGSTVDISAPGGDKNRYWPAAGVLSTVWNFQNSTPAYAYFNGTSMAAPHVTGVAALVWAANPWLSPAQVRDRLLDGAIDLLDPGIDNRTGAGLVNAYNAVTGTRGPSTSTLVRAVSTSTGAVVRSATVDGTGRFTLANLTPGSYYLVGGQDENGDSMFGWPGRRFGWTTGSQGMSAIDVQGTAVRNAALVLGRPVETEPNNLNTQANALAVDSWVSGFLLDPDVRDVYLVRIPAAGRYTFETSGVMGACYTALEVDTVLRLLDQNGSPIATNDDTPWPTASYPGQYCSRLELSLSAGTYYVEVTPSGMDFGSYRLHVRTGP